MLVWLTSGIVGSVLGSLGLRGSLHRLGIVLVIHSPFVGYTEELQI